MNVKLSMRTISALQKIIAGNPAGNEGPLSPYQSGPKLVAFFNELGFEDTYAGGFPSRWAYVETRLENINETDTMVRAVESSVDPGHFLDSEFDIEKAVEYLNRYLKLDGLSLALVGTHYKLRNDKEPVVTVETPFEPEERCSHEFITEQLAKCDRKLTDEDYDGAITNARSLIEAVLCDIEARISGASGTYDGDLQALFKRVQKLLNLEPERPDIAESLKPLLRGLVNIVSGLAPLRNKMGDAHVRTYKPARHHAKLAVNAAKTLVDFVYDTFEFQKAKGTITEALGPSS